jgi:2,5-furandicarboxylate decarboxylase 1
MRDFIETLRKAGELLRLRAPLAPKHEISAVLHEVGGRDAPAILFENVKGYTLPVVGNLFGTKRRIALALGLHENRMPEEALSRLRHRLAPRPISEKDEGKRILWKDGIDLLSLIPVLTYYAKDSGPYITSGITSARDPRNGLIGRGLHRMEVRGKDCLGISLLTPPLSDIYLQYKMEGRKMEVATVIGVHPAVLIASVLRVPSGLDKLFLAGGLMGRPVSVVTAETVDLEIPAAAEITIEGYIDPKGKEQDGTLGESSGYYMTFPRSPTIQVTAITCRKGTLYHAIMPWGLEVDYLLSFIHGMDLIPKLREKIPSLERVHLIPKTFGSHVVMSLDTDSRKEVRAALAVALSLPRVKKAIAVNTDVDPEDLREVEWAMATRFQGDKDLLVLRNLRGQAIDPSTSKGFVTAKIGINATRPRRQGFEKVDVPWSVKRRLTPLLRDLGEKLRKEIR